MTQGTKSSFKLLLALFILFAVIIFMYAILSQPLGIITDQLNNAYPNTNGSNHTIDYSVGRSQNSNIQTFLVLGLGAAVIIGLIFLFIFYGYAHFGGGRGHDFG